MIHSAKRDHPPGTSPGTVTQPGKTGSVPFKLLLMDFTATECHEKELASPEECRPYLDRDTVTWLHVQGDAAPDTMHQLGNLFGLHHLALEDVSNTGQRPKVDEYAEQVFVVLSHPVVGADGETINVHQLSLFLGKNFVISFYPGGDDPFEPVRKRLRDRVGRLRERGSDYLLQALIDLVIDDGFPLLEWLGDEIQQLEEEMLETPTSTNLRRLYQLKRTLVILRRVLWPQREVVNRLVRGDVAHVSDGARIYFSDCYDHTIQIMDLIESYRDMATGLLDVYLSSVSYRLNEVMRVLTVIATIFIPLTFIVGVYGMNFVNQESPWAMPELRWYYGYPMIWLLMVAVAAGMLLFFRKRKWL